MCGCMTHAVDVAAQTRACFLHASSVYEVIELLEGPDLFEFLVFRKETVPEPTAALLAKQMFSAINFLHAKVARSAAGPVHATRSLPEFFRRGAAFSHGHSRLYSMTSVGAR